MVLWCLEMFSCTLGYLKRRRKQKSSFAKKTFTTTRKRSITPLTSQSRNWTRETNKNLRLWLLLDEIIKNSNFIRKSNVCKEECPFVIRIIFQGWSGVNLCWRPTNVDYKSEALWKFALILIFFCFCWLCTVVTFLALKRLLKTSRFSVNYRWHRWWSPHS